MTTTTAREFIAFPKIPRLFRDMTITEKLDGTNACVVVTEEGDVYAQSRKRVVTPEDDNFGFARWTQEHKDELIHLGPGRHYGEWWGQGIQRGYGLDEKRFSLFNVDKWSDEQPGCCHVVPVLSRGDFETVWVEEAVEFLAEYGSRAAPGFMDPEGIIVWHGHARKMFKVTLDGDGHKGS